MYVHNTDLVEVGCRGTWRPKGGEKEKEFLLRRIALALAAEDNPSRRKYLCCRSRLNDEMCARIGLCLILVGAVRLLLLPIAILGYSIARST